MQEMSIIDTRQKQPYNTLKYTTYTIMHKHVKFMLIDARDVNL